MNDKNLIIQLRPGIGDMCVFLSSIHEIIKRENKNFTLLTKKRTRAKNFLQEDNLIKEVVYIEDLKKSKFFGNIKILYFLKRNQFNKVFIMHYGIKYFILCKLAQVKKVLHYNFIKKNENISKKIYNTTLSWLNIKKYDQTSKIKYTGEAYGQNKILIGIGSSGQSRRWDTNNFVELISKFNKLSNFDFYILGGKSEKNQSDDIINQLNQNNINCLCDHEIYDTFKYIKNSNFYVGTDSAFMHLSSALNVKTYGLFGDTPTNYSEYSNLIKPIIPKGYDSITHGSNAMKKIIPEDVFVTIKNDLF